MEKLNSSAALVAKLLVHVFELKYFTRLASEQSENVSYACKCAPLDC